MEKEGQPGDKNRPSHWFEVPKGYALECLVIGEGEQRRVYAVTTSSPAEHAWILERWPLLTSLKGTQGRPPSDELHLAGDGPLRDAANGR